MVAVLNSRDSFYYYFPSKEILADTNMLANLVKTEKDLGLMSLANGVDSIEIRIRYGHMRTDRLVILSNKDNGWKAEVSTLGVDVKPEFDYYHQHRGSEIGKMYTVTRTIQQKTPKSGWKKFINKLFDLGILSLPDEHDLPNYSPAGADGFDVFVQVATKKVYRAYWYTNPDFRLDKHKEMRSISTIVKLLDEEFDQEFLWNYLNEKP